MFFCVGQWMIKCISMLIEHLRLDLIETVSRLRVRV